MLSKRGNGVYLRFLSNFAPSISVTELQNMFPSLSNIMFWNRAGVLAITRLLC